MLARAAVGRRRVQTLKITDIQYVRIGTVTSGLILELIIAFHLNAAAQFKPLKTRATHKAWHLALALI